MNLLTKEWIEKAEEDYRTAIREIRVKKEPSYDVVCFHAQQCVEKYLKALLQEKKTRFPNTHDLVELLRLCLTSYPQLEKYKESFSKITDYAVDFRYPGIFATRATAKEAVEIMKEAKKSIRRCLGK